VGAGPVLGLILTGAALHGANVGTTLLLLAYAAGAATSLALALAVGGRVFAAMKRSLGIGEWIRRGLGIAVLGAVVAIAFGFDTGFLTRISLSSTASIEQALVDRLRPNAKSGDSASTQVKPEAPDANLAVEGGFPSLSGAVAWLNSPPLTAEGLKGKVVVIDFWTYSCINCLRSIPYVRAWAEKYKDHGLVVIGVHTPEFAFERNIDNVRTAVADLKIGYPVAIDNDYAIWRAFDNEYWPAHYFIDAQGHMRYHHFGEGEYDESERVIQRLLAEAGNSNVPADLVAVNASGAEAAPSTSDQSPRQFCLAGRHRRGRKPCLRGGDTADRSVVPNGRLDCQARERHARRGGRPHRLSISRARSPSRARSRRGRQAGQVPRDHRRRGTRRKSRRRHRRRRSRRGRRTASVPAHSAERRNYRSHVRDRVSRSRGPGLRLYVRLTRRILRPVHYAQCHPVLMDLTAATLYSYE
jgi:thiol-disulfide isomerase/thioredoxin